MSRHTLILIQHRPFMSSLPDTLKVPVHICEFTRPEGWYVKISSKRGDNTAGHCLWLIVCGVVTQSYLINYGLFATHRQPQPPLPL